MQYEPALNYKRSFVPKEGQTVWIKYNVQYKFTNGNLTLKSMKEEICMFDSNDPEELIYTYYTFQTKAEDLDLPEHELGQQFAKVLNPGPQRE